MSGIEPVGQDGAPFERVRFPEFDKPGTSAAKGPAFGELIQRGLQDVSELQHDVKSKVQGLVTGETEDVHEVLVAMGKAEVAFQMMLQVRNRLVDAWREISRIHV